MPIESTNKYDSFLYTFASMIILSLATWLCSGVRIEHLSIIYLSIVFFFFLGLFSKDAIIPKGNPLFYCFLILTFLTIIQYLNPSVVVERNELYSSQIRRIDYIKFLPHSIKSSIYEDNALVSILRLISYTVVIWIFTNTFRSTRNRNFLPIFFSVSVALLGIVALIQQYYGLNSIYGIFFSKSKIYGSFFLENAAGTFLGIGLIITIATLIKSRTKPISILLIFCLIATSTAMILNPSLGSKIEFLSILSIAIIIFLLRKKSPLRFILLSILLISIPLLFFYYLKTNTYYTQTLLQIFSDSIISRLKLYKISISIFLENPILGIGGGGFKYAVLPILSTHNGIISSPEHAHCDIIELFINHGAIGGCILIFSLLLFYIRTFPAKKDISCKILYYGSVICLIKSIVDIDFYITSIGIAWLFLATLIYSKRSNSNQDFAIKPNIMALSIKLILISFALLTSFNLLASYTNQLIPEEKSIRFEILRAAAEFNNKGIAQQQHKLLIGTEYETAADTIIGVMDKKKCPIEDYITLEIMRKIRKEEKDISSREIRSVSFITKPSNKLHVYSNILNNCDISDNDYNFIIREISPLIKKQPTTLQPYFEYIAKAALARCDIVTASNVLINMRDGISKALAVYSAHNSIGSVIKIRPIFKDGKFYNLGKMCDYCILVNRHARRKEYKEIEKQLRYTAYQYLLDRNISASISCLPIYTYIFGKIGNEELYNKYRDKMVSSKARSLAIGNYVTYIESATKALAAFGETKKSLELIETLNSRHQKMNVLKFCIKDLIRTEEDLLDVVNYLDSS